MKRFIFILLAIVLFSCSENDGTGPRDSKNEFNIYLVEKKDESFASEEIDLELLELENTPWIKSSDIEFYDWSAHTFYLNKEVQKEKHSASNFVVTSGEKRLFMGVFWPMYMSSFPMIPTIVPEDDWFTPKDIIRFNAFGWNLLNNLSDNENFKTELMNAGLYREGIEVKITGLNKMNPTTLRYTFEVTNRDIETIYILDPEKMGASRFHYYTNGPHLQKNDGYFWPADFETTASEQIDPGWYFKLKSGETITRTVEHNAYTALPSGKVKTTFRFPGTHMTTTGAWKKSDGRIWIGDYYSEQEITIN